MNTTIKEETTLKTRATNRVLFAGIGMILLGVFSYTGMSNGLLVFLMIDGSPIIGGLLLLRKYSKKCWIISVVILMFVFTSNSGTIPYYFDYLLHYQELNSGGSGLLNLTGMDFSPYLRSLFLRCICSLVLLVVMHTGLMRKAFRIKKDDILFALAVGVLYTLICRYF